MSLRSRACTTPDRHGEIGRIKAAWGTVVLALSACGNIYSNPYAPIPPTTVPVASTSSANEAGAQFTARADGLLKEAREILAIFDADEATCLPSPCVTFHTCISTCKGGDLGRSAGQVIADVQQATQCAPRCTATLDRAERQLAAIRPRVAELRELREKKQALDDALAACKADVGTCEQTCASDPASVKCIALAGMLDVGDDAAKIARSPGKARDLLRKGCNAGNRAACEASADLELKAGRCGAMDVCKVYCDGGFGMACSAIASLYQSGNGVAPSASTALAFLKKGCDLGDPGSCHTVGAAYFEGQGVPRDRVAAQAFFKRACDGQTAKLSASPLPPGPLGPELRARWCADEHGTSCVNRVQSPAHRRPDLDATCRKLLLPAAAWSTLNGTDNDECLNAMMNRGCQQVMNLKAYCCPNN